MQSRGPPAADDSGFTNGFELPLIRPIFSGNVLDPNLSFKIEGQFSDSSEGNFDLLDAFAAYKYSDEFTIAGGQFQIPLMREWSLSPFGVQARGRRRHRRLLPATPRAIWMVYQADAFKAIVAIDDAAKSQNTRWHERLRSRRRPDRPHRGQALGRLGPVQRHVQLEERQRYRDPAGPGARLPAQRQHSPRLGLRCPDQLLPVDR